MRKALFEVKIRRDSILNLVRVLKEFKNRREQGFKTLSFNKMNLRPILKASKIT